MERGGCVFYYIKKFWKLSGLIIFLLFIDAGLASYRSLALMESLEELVRGNFRGFLFWTLLNLLCGVLVQVLVAISALGLIAAVIEIRTGRLVQLRVVIHHQYPDHNLCPPFHLFPCAAASQCARA